MTLNAVLRYGAYFRAAEACKGLELREATVFEGTEEKPCEVEVDEAVAKRRYVKDPYCGMLVGTWHYSFFAMKQRGSRRGVVYAMRPRYARTA